MTYDKGTRTHAKRPASESAKAQATNTPLTYDFSDIAALLVVMLRNTTAGGGAYTSFADQLAASTNLLPGNQIFSESMQVVSFLFKQQPALFDDLHMAVRKLLETLENTKTEQGVERSVCSFISQDQIAVVAGL